MVAVGSVYGCLWVDRVAGPPAQWLSDTWQGFTAGRSIVLPGWEEPPFSRLVTVSANGRWEEWTEARADLLSAPWTGRGVGLFEAQIGTAGGRHASSTELHALAESGAVGASLLLGAIGLALAGLAYPRFSAGWRGARASWLRRPQKAPPEKTASEEQAAGDDAEPPPSASPDSAGEPAVGPPNGDQPTTPSRWGTEPGEYGWETAVAVAALYWLLHGGIEWLWQGPAVTIPVLLLLASGLAEIDSRAGAVWPRWGSVLRRLGRSRSAARIAPHVREQSDPSRQADGEVTRDARSGVLDPSFNTYRRADRHARRQQRRANLEAYRDRVSQAMQPPGAVSQSFRWGLGTASLVVAGALAYGYLRFLI
jgi:hypothetical protein